ncbi:MAG TPA: hypothetical protein VFZ10_13370 [Geminicoccaceae bacterium]
MAAALLVAALPWSGDCDTPAKASSGDQGVIEVYAQEPWYRARPETERRWRGELQERLVTLGPAGRTSLSFTLVTDEGDLAVYAAGVAQLLAPLAGRPVEARGKLVDLRGEELGQELWIGSIRPLGERPR